MHSSSSIGIQVDSSPAKRPARITLPGRIVSLLPLQPALHAEALYQEFHGPNNEDLWLYMSEGPFADRASFDRELARKAIFEDTLFFAILENSSGRALGYAAFLRIEPAHRCMEVGNIVLSPNLQRTTGATEAMYLMARYVFEELGFRRYEWKCNALNTPSRRAALRLGFTFEGIFRQHMIVKGRNRDTAWSSILDSEWPSRKVALERWLHPSNFDAAGRQKQSLSAMRALAQSESPK